MAFPVIFLLGSECYRSSAAEKLPASDLKLNVLFIALDDLRPELACYGRTFVRSPNIDRLAAEGLRFNRAYCQQAICGPSRASLMTGLRPDSTGVIHNEASFRDKNPDVVTLQQHFRMNGYQTVHVGKIFHPNMIDLEKSWSMRPAANWMRGSAPYQLAENKQWIAEKRRELEDRWGQSPGFIPGPVTEAADVPDEAYLDGRVAAEAIQLLRKLEADAGKPFFLGVGFHKPHLPWIAPKRYWDLYDPAVIPLAANPSAPVGMSAIALHDSFELRSYGRAPKTEPIGEAAARHFLHGYLACVSYADNQVGKVLDELDRLGLRDRTIVILWGDHGWHLNRSWIISHAGRTETYQLRSPVTITRIPELYRDSERAIRRRAGASLRRIGPLEAIQVAKDVPPSSLSNSRNRLRARCRSLPKASGETLVPIWMPNSRARSSIFTLGRLLRRRSTAASIPAGATAVSVSMRARIRAVIIWRLSRS
jgi:arylsulfatase A-like enzyme